MQARRRVRSPAQNRNTGGGQKKVAEMAIVALLSRRMSASVQGNGSGQNGTYARAVGGRIHGEYRARTVQYLSRECSAVARRRVPDGREQMPGGVVQQPLRRSSPYVPWQRTNIGGEEGENTGGEKIRKEEEEE